jgi:hypothetical protein
MSSIHCERCDQLVFEGQQFPCPRGRGDLGYGCWIVEQQLAKQGGTVPEDTVPRANDHLRVMTAKEIVCPYCYLATQLAISTEPRVPSPRNLWLCHECKNLSVFTDNLDLREATEIETAKVMPLL